MLVIDQLEELFTMCRDPEVRDAFAGALAGAARAPEDPVRVIITLRDDFLVRTQELAKVREAIADGLFLLATPGETDLVRIVTEPCRRVGYEFDDRELPTRMVADVVGRPAALALLSFTAEKLWELRDRHFRRLREAAYRSTGGVAGALARHADGVIEALLPVQREAARSILLRLVSPERTRLKLDASSLSGVDRPALDALVRGRLVVADDATYELAHEVLIVGWPTLAGWLSEDLQLVQVRGRLTIAVAEWLRLERTTAGLWQATHLADLRALDGEQLTADERAFVRASLRAIRRRTNMRRAIMVAVPIAIAAFYGGARMIARRDLDERIGVGVAAADRTLELARVAETAGARQRREAFARFDAGDIEGGEQLWKPASELSDQARTQYAEAARSLEAAFLLDTSRDDVRRKLSEVTFERLQLATRDHRDAEAADFKSRLSLYDSDREFAARLSAPGTLDLHLDPPSMELSIDGAVFAGGSLEPGSHALVARAPGRAEIQSPFVIAPGEHRRLDLSLPLAKAIPDGFIVIPAGRFLYGSRDDDYLRRFFITAPMHELSTGSYLIARNEVTYAQWIEFLEAVGADERKERVPHLDSSQPAPGVPGSLALAQTRAGWEIQINPSSIEYRVAAGSQLEYRERARRVSQDWRVFPVAAISPRDAEAFAAWLARTGKVPHARLCTEREWERAARGADGRPFPHGDKLAGDEANIDETYNRKDGGFGPDAVGSHPVSISPHGLLDTSGNVWEITRLATGEGYVMRGGGFYTDSMTAHLANRQEIPATFRHLHTGLRLCADVP
ncbi:MAG: SUMF1/EgtB/PvdO family nonheme iron enzyme [Deltaproteobacteria bacterium]|nr:SUMF1/EgtB/PvdO family nonheme iron enzyme [Deltaproteobacteria bacterium]